MLTALLIDNCRPHTILILFTGNSGRANDFRQVPQLFDRAEQYNSLTACQTLIDYEGELAVIIGKRCKDVTEQDALHYVAGYSLINDVTARDIQAQTSQWTAGKALDTFAPMGPGLVLASEIPDPQALTLITRVNGQVVQHDRTTNMIFSVAAAIAFLSSLMTLEPGDIIATGTPPGVGFRRTPPLYLKDGDLVEVEIERIGTPRNPVKRADQCRKASL